MTSPLESLPCRSSSDDEALSLTAMVVGPVDLTVGDCFEKRGRRLIGWQVDAITRHPHVGRIITFAEIDGVARIQVRATDILDMGFSRL